MSKIFLGVEKGKKKKFAGGDAQNWKILGGFSRRLEKEIRNGNFTDFVFVIIIQSIISNLNKIGTVERAEDWIPMLRWKNIFLLKILIYFFFNFYII